MVASGYIATIERDKCFTEHNSQYSNQFRVKKVVIYEHYYLKLMYFNERNTVL